MDKGIKVQISGDVRVLDSARPQAAPAEPDGDLRFIVNDIRNFTLSWKLHCHIAAISSSATTWNRRDFADFLGDRVPRQTPADGTIMSDSLTIRSFTAAIHWPTSHRPFALLRIGRARDLFRSVTPTTASSQPRSEA